MSAPPEQLAISKPSPSVDATDISTMVHESSQKLPHVTTNDTDNVQNAEPLYTSVKRIKSDYADGSKAGQHQKVCCNTKWFMYMRQR